MISSIEQELFNEIKKYIPDVKSQLKIANKNHRYVYDISYKNKIIELNGDYWHGNPEIYNYDDYVRNDMQAWQLWEYDTKKSQFAESYGYELMTIWESDLRNMPKTTLKKCIDFLIS